MATTTHDAWAIGLFPEGGLLGMHWWFDEGPPIIPTHLLGAKKALFATRQSAREALPRVKKSFPHAKIYKVVVRINVLKAEDE